MSSASPSDMLSKVQGLLQPQVRSQSEIVSGYIEVLGKQDRLGRQPNQWVFRSRIIPLIYERVGRPLGAKYIFGRKLSFAEENEITFGMLDLSPTDRVLDVGCGPGNYTRRIAEFAGEGIVVGIDPADAMIAAAVERGGGANLAYVRGDGSELPFQGGQFDAVCCVGVLHLVKEPMKALDEMVRVLAPGGRVVIGTTCKGDEGSRVRAKITMFGSQAVTGALTDRGLVEVGQKLTGRGQFVSARKTE